MDLLPVGAAMVGENNVRRAFEAGDVVFGATCVTMVEEVIEAYGALGLDCVWLGLEHNGPSPYDSEALKTYVRAADRVGIDLVVRLPGTDPFMVRKVLDAGVRNVTVPRVETAADVERAVRAARFTHDGGPGDRGAGMCLANEWATEMAGYAGREDDDVCVGVMIENETAVGNLDEILAVPDLAYVRVGRGDLSVSMGRPLEHGHADVDALDERVRAKAAEHGVPVGGRFTDPEAIRAAIDEGYRYVLLGSDLGVVRSVLGERFEAVREHAGR